MPAAPTFLGRALRYGEKVYGLCSRLRAVRDGRRHPRVPADRTALAWLLLLLGRKGSLNAMEQCEPGPVWRRWLGGALPSADVMGDAAQTLDVEALRAVLSHQYARGRRNKGLCAGDSGLRFLVLDGHEGVSSHRRRWQGCLERMVRFDGGVRTQHYFRYVGAYLTNGRWRLLLDAEVQLPREGEAACALRLMARLLKRHTRAFDVVCGDNLYMDPTLWKLVRAHKKHLIAVLKNENRDLLVDARSLFAQTEPSDFDEGATRRVCWDLEGFTSWPQCGEPVRVVRSVEHTAIRRQLDGNEETVSSEWFWVTSLPARLAPVKTVVRAGHGRWHIENRAFNELGSQWHGDHAYRHDAHALLACTLLLFIAYNLFHAFIENNLKPQARAGRTEKYWAGLIAAELAVAFHRRSKPT